MSVAAASASAAPDENRARDDAIQFLFDNAAKALGETRSPTRATAKLEEMGVSKEIATEAVNALMSRARESVIEAKRGRGARNIGFGLLWFVGGAIVTAVTYQAAVSGGGGKYMVAWGAILFGGIQALIGCAQRFGTPSDEEIAAAFAR